MGPVGGWLASATDWGQKREAFGSLFHHHYSLMYNLTEMPHCQESPTNVLTVDIMLNTFVFLLTLINSVFFIISQ